MFNSFLTQQMALSAQNFQKSKYRNWLFFRKQIEPTGWMDRIRTAGVVGCGAPPPSAVGCPRYLTYWKFFRRPNYFLITFHFSARLNGRLSCQNHLIWPEYHFNNFRNWTLGHLSFKAGKMVKIVQSVDNGRIISANCRLVHFRRETAPIFSIRCIQILSPPCVLCER